jgi:hypothetical protein
MCQCRRHRKMSGTPWRTCAMRLNKPMGQEKTYV